MNKYEKSQQILAYFLALKAALRPEDCLTDLPEPIQRALEWLTSALVSPQAATRLMQAFDIAPGDQNTRLVLVVRLAVLVLRQLPDLPLPPFPAEDVAELDARYEEIAIMTTNPPPYVM